MTIPQSPPVKNRGPIPITSIPTALTYSPAIGWFQVVTAGSGALVVKDESGITRSYSDLAAGVSYAGPFTEITSMTCTKIMVGDGDPPTTLLPSSAVPATTSIVGGTTMSVAPASAATPIAVGTNDPRVTTLRIPLPLVLTDGTMAESTIAIPGVVGTITAATLSANAAITQNDTNYLTFTLAIRDGAGGGASTVAAKSTAVTGGGAFLAFVPLTLGAITNPTTTATSQVTFKSVKTGSGQAVTGPAFLLVTYTVP